MEVISEITSNHFSELINILADLIFSLNSKERETATVYLLPGSVHPPRALEITTR